MKSFSGPSSVSSTEVNDDHDGSGLIFFRRLFDSQEFVTRIDFVDFTIIPPGSSIGYHAHNYNEELYLISKGSPMVKIAGSEMRLNPGCVAVVRSGQSHGLWNDTEEEVRIFVVQVRQ